MKRLENETFEDYKKRRKLTQKTIKQKLLGRWFFKSSLRGTYIKPKTEPKESFTKNLRNEKGYGDFLKNKQLSA